MRGSRFLMVATLMLSCVSVHAQDSQSQAREIKSTPMPQGQNPVQWAMLDCHYQFAEAHYRGSATATEIATSSLYSCQKETRDMLEEVYRSAISKGASPGLAEGVKNDMVTEYKNMLLGLTMQWVLELRSKQGK